MGPSVFRRYDAESQNMQPIAKAITMIQPRQARGELEVSKKMLLMLMMYKLLWAKVNQKGANQGVTIRKSR
jgi:hypothetical protein